MKKYKVRIQGSSAMLMNKLSKELLTELSKIKKDELPQWEENNWQKKAYSINEGDNIQYILPELVLRAMVIEAGKKATTRCPKEIGRTWTNYLKSSVLIIEPALLENVTIQPFGSMVNGNPSSGKGSSKVYKIRPLISKGWVGEFVIMDLVEKMDNESITEILSAGGKFVGVGDWRPMHGRFEVISVEEI
jgi:hypothetical protein